MIRYDPDLHALAIVAIEKRSCDNDGSPRALSPWMLSTLLELWQRTEMPAADRSRLVALIENQLCLMVSTDPSVAPTLDWVPPTVRSFFFPACADGPADARAGGHRGVQPGGCRWRGRA